MVKPEINYNYWLKNWTNTVGNIPAYTNVNIQQWSNFQGNLMECENQILQIVNQDEINKNDILRAIDLINQWGGKTARTFYIQRPKGNPRQLITEQENLDKYKEAIELARDNNFEAANKFNQVYGIGVSFMGKHAQFWSNFNLAILDQKIAGALGHNSPTELLNQHSYADFMNHINTLKADNNLNNPVEVERALFAFHNNYFDNGNTRFNASIDDNTDLEYAQYIANILGIDN